MTDTNAAVVVEGQFADAEPLTDAQKIQAAVDKAKAEQDAANDAKRMTRKGRRVGKPQRIDHPTYEEWVEARKPSSADLMTILGMQMGASAQEKPDATEADKVAAAKNLAENWRHMQIFALSKSLTAWSLVDGDDKPRPVTLEAIAACEWDFIGELYDEMANQGFFG